MMLAWMTKNASIGPSRDWRPLLWHTLALRRLSLAVPLVGTLGIAGCNSINPFDRGSTEPLPPVTGNVIATSSSRDMAARIGSPDQAAQSGIVVPAEPQATGGAAATAQ